MATLTSSRVQAGSYGGFRQVGTAPNELWKALGVIGATTLTTLSINIGMIRAYPFLTGAGGVIDRLAFEVTTVGSAGSVGYVAIYSSINDTTLYPGALVVSGSEFDCTVTGGTGVKATTVSAYLEPGKLYWFVSRTGVAAPTVRAFTSVGSGGPSIFGLGASGGANPRTALNGTLAYAATPPSVYPAAVTLSTITTGPLVAVRFAA